jgi:hypothetical protein
MTPRIVAGIGDNELDGDLFVPELWRQPGSMGSRGLEVL